MKVLTNLDGKIMSLCQVDDITREIDESEGIITKLIECKRKIASAMSNPVSTSTISSDPVAATVRPAAKLQLPKLTLPKFRGVVTRGVASGTRLRQQYITMTVFLKLTSLIT